MWPLAIVLFTSVAVVVVHGIAGPSFNLSVNARQKRQMLASATQKWPIVYQDGFTPLPIPFVFDDVSLILAYGAESENVKNRIRAALAFWQQHTCIDFQEYDFFSILPSLAHVSFQADGLGCRSDVGFFLNPPAHICNIDPSGATFYTITHEIGHVLGLYHEQVRYNRDSYVRITNTGSQQNAIPAAGVLTDYKPYDFGSVMHYGDGDFWEEMFATNRYSLYDSTLGNRQGPTYWDLRHVSQEYGCPTIRQHNCNDAHLTCGNNGYLHPRLCNVCVCPQGFAGPACEDLAHGDNGALPNCGRVAQATDAWQTLSGQITGNDRDYTGPPACCYYHIKVPLGKRVEIQVDSIDAEMHRSTHELGDASHEHNHCVSGSLEIAFEDLTVSGAKICMEQNRDFFNDYGIKSSGNVVLLKNCAHQGRVAFTVSHRIAPASSSGAACRNRKRRAIDLHTNCTEMLKKYGSCSGHSYSKLMKVVCRQTCKSTTTDC